ncbi:alpha-D-ribose 1-methylphosphonate 5-triphosphate diphosphatase [Vineibacter terrae]|uniref:alpha-D-ribose 1-methylphosphonate 5-triphosphate diphosphatase n=1 Tax=Vineibacter terrae TaxID=2586908 RepID=UPI002E352E9D|nr:alpha-D-ribose 1-methylphosphonate 5-triphosphate diphosphatase [Vineibacter terrae]HEX2889347.1 alpha-D-ribose 1-methylphosphonate 5-triphosphate diphosphatase [Vineibacter terrae]
MMSELVLTDARIVTPHAVVTGTVVVQGGVIAAIDAGRAAAGEGLDGDYLIPGLVELHTDNMERHFAPRPGVRWPSVSAAMAHDAQIAAAGITTVFDAIALGSTQDHDMRITSLAEMLGGTRTARDNGMLRSDHLLHLRCEVSYPQMPDMLADMIGDPRVRLVSVMDHTPGQRQFVNPEKYREYYKGKYGFSEAELDTYLDMARARGARHSADNRRAVTTICQQHGVPMASHDDATPDHVAEALADGMVVAEFPTTVEAARLSRAGGMKVVMGGPNLIRGGSHSGNVSAGMLAELGLLDIVSSDYVPTSLVESAFKLAQDVPGIDLPKAMAAVSQTAAEAVGLSDRGAIEVGRRGDLVRVRLVDGQPVVRTVWRDGTRVA